MDDICKINCIHPAPWFFRCLRVSLFCCYIPSSLTDASGHHQISLVMSKTKVEPIKRLSIPRLELCGAQMPSQLLHHVKRKIADSRIIPRELSATPYHSKHPLILPAKHKLTHLITHSEHLRLLHAGPTLLIASLNRRYHIIGGSKNVRSKCVVCRKLSAKPHPQMLGQLPIERVTPDSVFEKVGIDYAGPVSIKYGHVRKPTIVKAYIHVSESSTLGISNRPNFRCLHRLS